MEDTSKPPRHCEERSDEAIFFSLQPVYTCFRAPSGVQNRAISRYMLFVAWKLYTCRFATATNKMFFFSQKPIYNQSTIGEKRLFLREQKQTACVHRRALRFCTAAQNEQPLYINFLALRKTSRVCRFSLFRRTSPVANPVHSLQDLPQDEL